MKFEDTLTKDILPKAAFWMDQYNSIHASTEFSPEQKQILLEQRLVNVRNQFNTLSVDYRKALAEVYKLVPSADLALVTSKSFSKLLCAESDSDMVDVFYKTNGRMIGRKASFKFSTFDKDDSYYVSVDMNGSPFLSNLLSSGFIYQVISFIENTSCKDRYRMQVDVHKFISHSMVKPRLQFLGNDLYRSIYPAIKGQCRSSICVGLRSGDLVNLLTQISTKLDRVIQMKLASGETVSLTGIHNDLSVIQSMLARTDYPETLPFDI